MKKEALAANAEEAKVRQKKGDVVEATVEVKM